LNGFILIILLGLSQKQEMRGVTKYLTAKCVSFLIGGNGILAHSSGCGNDAAKYVDPSPTSGTG
jgi:hypothetical protein